MAKLRINGDSSGYVDLEAPNAASSSTLDLDQVPQKNVANTFSADMSFGDNNKVNLGAGNDLQLYHDGSNNYIKSAAAGWLNVPLSGNGMTVANSNFSNIFFKIDSSGRVVTPKQPCAWVTGTGDYVAMNNELMRFTVINNETGGSNYSTSSKLYTCPVAGWYECSAHALTQATQACEFQLKKNGTTVARRYVSSGRGISAHNVVYCSANDTLGWFWASSGSVHYQGGVDAYSSALYRLVG